MSESLQSYYELVRDNDLSARGGSGCVVGGGGGPILHRKRLRGIQIQKRILPERLERNLLARLSLGNIFTTGLPLEGAGRYYSS